MKNFLEAKAVQITFKVLPFLISAVLILKTVLGKGFSLEVFLSRRPQSYLLTTLIFLMLFAVKSFSVIFPISALFIASGIVFPPVPAVLISWAGVFICCSIPYAMGYHSQSNFISKYLEKHPALMKRVAAQAEHPWFISYFLRVVRILPVDIVSTYLGQLKIPYKIYITASLLGIIPTAFFTTLIGSAIENPSSPMFKISIIMTVFISVVSLVIYYFYDRIKDKSEA